MSRRLRVIQGGAVEMSGDPTPLRRGGVRLGIVRVPPTTPPRSSAVAEVDSAATAAAIEAAREVGRNEGHAVGFAAGKRAAEATIASVREEMARTVDGIAAAVADERRVMEQDAVEAALRAGVEIARRILEREVVVDPSVVVANLQACLERLSGATEVEVRVHPADFEWLSASGRRPSHGRARIRYSEDASIERGGCEVVSDVGRVDGRIATQLRAVLEHLGGIDVESWLGAGVGGGG